MSVQRSQAGFALVIVLWTVAILALLVTAIVGNARRETRLADTLKQIAAGKAAADGALAQEVMDTLRSGTATTETLTIGGVTILVTPRNLSGKVNPNVVSGRLLGSLLTGLGVAPGQAQSLAAAIVDWRSPGRVAGQHGAKAPEYRAAGRSYGPPDRPFESLDELRYVLGMTQPILAVLKPHLSLWTDSDPDPSLSDPLVLSALRAIGPLPAAGRRQGPQIIDMTAVGTVARGMAVQRHAVIRFGFSPDGRAWRILEWDDGDGGNR